MTSSRRQPRHSWGEMGVHKGSIPGFHRGSIPGMIPGSISSSICRCSRVERPAVKKLVCCENAREWSPFFSPLVVTRLTFPVTLSQSYSIEATRNRYQRVGKVVRFVLSVSRVSRVSLPCVLHVEVTQTHRLCPGSYPAPPVSFYRYQSAPPGVFLPVPITEL